MTALSREAARRVYDRIGSFQDRQGFYEDRAVEALMRHGIFLAARSVFELGCGTGRLARRLLEEVLPPDAHYRGVDLSPVMVRLAEERLAPWAGRAEVALCDGAPPAGEPAEAYDRFLSTYVFDLLPEEEVRAMLREAHRMLVPGGLLCLAGLSPGRTPLSRVVARAWGWIQSMQPAWVGGCRPLALLPFLDPAAWEIVHHDVVVAFAVPSEVVVARRR